MRSTARPPTVSTSPSKNFSPAPPISSSPASIPGRMSASRISLIQERFRPPSRGLFSRSRPWPSRPLPTGTATFIIGRRPGLSSKRRSGCLSAAFPRALRSISTSHRLPSKAQKSLRSGKKSISRKSSKKRTPGKTPITGSAGEARRSSAAKPPTSERPIRDSFPSRPFIRI